MGEQCRTLRESKSARAVGAQPEDLQGVADVGEAVLGRHLVRPALDRGAVDLDCLAACPAHQVVVMGVAAGSVDALTILTDDDVDVTGLSERGECSIGMELKPLGCVNYDAVILHLNGNVS